MATSWQRGVSIGWTFAVLVLAAAAALPGCGSDPGMTKPDEAAVLAVLEEVLGAGRAPVAELPLAVHVVPEDDHAYCRPATAAEREQLFEAPEMGPFEIKAMRSKFYPAWKVLVDETESGRRKASYHVHVVELEGRLHMLLLPRPAMRLPDGRLVPDLRPIPGVGDKASGETFQMVILPAR